MMRMLKGLFGTKRQRDVKALRPLVQSMNAWEEKYRSLSDSQVQAKTAEFKSRLAGGETPEDILCEAFAVVKNACRRLVGTRYEVCGNEESWEMVPFDVQLMGGIVLHQGKIAEMATGEGKTLVATMPLYLNALAGHNVHLVTVNDYLARRDSEWMGLLYRWLGVSVGCIQNHMSPAERKIEYGKDITYGTNSEFGFDYLRDNGMACHPDEQVQRGYAFAIVDEVDSILIDEARTPLIISGPVYAATNRYFEMKPRVEQLVRRQRTLCNTLIQEARELLDKNEDEKAQYKLYQVYHGMPKHKQLMHMLEEPRIRKLHEQIENAMLTDMRKEQARELREALFFTIEERHHEASLTENGCNAMNPNDPDAYVLPDLVSAIAEIDADPSMSQAERTKRKQEIQNKFTERSEIIHNVDQLIRAYCLYEKDVEYVVQDNQVLIVDEFTGRILPGRRWSDGLHQAVEAKEGVKIERETQTLATITIQNYFRMYGKLAGMTGTAETEADEFNHIYKLDVVVIPTNRPVRRIDCNDVIYKTQREKFKALIDEIQDCYQRQQPVLVGTVSVETSELLSRMLKQAKITHNVLNAKNHAAEADIVRRAGRAGSVTIATNMAGRGTDIKLGEGVVGIDREVIVSSKSLDDKVNGRTLRETLLEKPCGLHVIGSERHEARRIDRQLRGRCARQGDPGSSRFYISLEDELMRLFGSDRIAGIMSRLGLEEGQQLEHRWLNRSIETAQRRVEQQNFSIRKRTLEYDDVMNRQREVIYSFRGEIVRSANVREHIYDVLHDVIVSRAEDTLKEAEDSELAEFVEWVRDQFPVPLQARDIAAKKEEPTALGEDVFERVKQAYDLKVSTEEGDSLRMMERQIVLHTIDTQWQDYLRSMDALRQGVSLRAYGQRDPLIEYKREAFQMFEELMSTIKDEIASAVFRTTTSLASFESFLSSLPHQLVHDELSLLGGSLPDGRPDAVPVPVGGEGAGNATATFSGSIVPLKRDAQKVGRNEPCPCGSGKKYKKCCGQ